MMLVDVSDEFFQSISLIFLKQLKEVYFDVANSEKGMLQNQVSQDFFITVIQLFDICLLISKSFLY